MKRSFFSALAVCTALVSIAPAYAQQAQMPQGDRKEQKMNLPQTHTIAVLPVVGPRLQNPMPSSVDGIPQKPASNEEIALSGATVERQINAIAQGASERIKNVRVGSGDMSIEATPDTTLRAILNHEAKMRQLSMLQGEVTASLGLWGTTYAGPREEIKKDNLPNGMAPVPLQPAIPVAQVKQSPEDKAADARKQKEDERAQAQAEADAKNQAIADDIAGRKRALGQIPPVVSSIYGSIKHPKAFILVPYMGSIEATHAGQTFNMIDGSVMKVTSISIDGVYASHAGRKPKLLGFGTTVPTEADAVTMFNAISAPEAANAQRLGDHDNPAPPPDGPPGGGQAFGMTATRGVPLPQ